MTSSHRNVDRFFVFQPFQNARRTQATEWREPPEELIPQQLVVIHKGSTRGGVSPSRDLEFVDERGRERRMRPISQGGLLEPLPPIATVKGGHHELSVSTATKYIDTPVGADSAGPNDTEESYVEWNKVIREWRQHRSPE